LTGENQGGLDLQPGGAAALGHHESGDDESPSVEVGSFRRLARRVSVLAFAAGTLIALVAWIAVLVYGAIWVVERVPV
jgi:hypothetical protein